MASFRMVCINRRNLQEHVSNLIPLWGSTRDSEIRQLKRKGRVHSTFGMAHHSFFPVGGGQESSNAQISPLKV